jgi:hypothetical protein
VQKRKNDDCPRQNESEQDRKSRRIPVSNGHSILLPLPLYVLLKPVNKNIALLMVLFVFVPVPIAMLNTLNNHAALSLLSGAGYLTVFTW